MRIDTGCAWDQDNMFDCAQEKVAHVMADMNTMLELSSRNLPSDVMASSLGSFGYLSCLCFNNYVLGVVNSSRA